MNNTFKLFFLCVITLLARNHAMAQENVTMDFETLGQSISTTLNQPNKVRPSDDDHWDFLEFNEGDETVTNLASSNWSIGLAIGGHLSSLRYSLLPDDVYGSNTPLPSEIVSLFAEYSIDAKSHFTVRPQLTYLRRGGILKGIEVVGKSIPCLDDSEGSYTSRVTYTDFRVPILYHFGTETARIRPYVFVAPVISMACGGQFSLETLAKDGISYAGVRVPVSNANVNPLLLAGEFGIGAKLAIPMGSTQGYIGLEAYYEQGLSDTYSKMERKGISENVTGYAYDIQGKRTFIGVGCQLTLSVPVNLFKEKPTKIEYVTVEKVVEKPVFHEKKTEMAVEKNCYSLDEVQQMMAQGLPVFGKTICAIDDVHFDFDKSDVKKESYPYLDSLVDVFNHIGCSIVISAHTDNIGTEEYNIKLSEERAEAVAEYFKSKGFNVSRIQTKGCGSRCPLADNGTEEGRAVNRRVEFEILN